MTNQSAIAIYCDQLLPYSATFVKSQAEGLRNFEPYYVGSRRVKGLVLPDDYTIVVNSGRSFGMLEELVYKRLHLAPAFWQRLRSLSPALIHAHFGPDGVIALPLSRGLGIPLVVTFHGYDATTKDEYARKSFYNHRVYLRQRETLQNEAHLFIAVSHFIQEKLLAQGFPPEKIVVHHIGVNTELFQPDVSIDREPVVLFVGRFVEKKGCEYLIRAMDSVQATLPETQLVLIGDGPLRPELEALAASLLRNYRFLGSQDSTVVKQWMNRARLLCVPSVTAESGDSEGVPIVILEAQAMGLPVVGSRHSGIADAIAHGETGFLANEQDWQQLSQNILQLFNDSPLWQQFSQQGRVRVEALFNLKTQTQKLEALYQQVLDR